ncbi:MAG: DNA/RNA nuclease SfsA [Proteobacteria bacterium]|nr:DNA/RNA nuclease SfsA [Pseudomonadota bacterium]
MLFDPPLQPARLVRRYKRFLADMLLPDGRTVTAHCPNPGSMLGLAAPNSPCWLSTKAAKGRKLDFGWEIVETPDGAKVGINTGHANRVVAEALAKGAIAGLPITGQWRAEVPFGTGTRFDFCHTADDGTLTFLEVKSVTLSRAPGLAEFPDSRTERGAKHLRELMVAQKMGHRAALLFLIQRGDCREMQAAADVDPAYAAGLEAARSGGVEILSYACDVATTGIFLTNPIAFRA